MKKRLIKVPMYRNNSKKGLTYVIEKQIPFKIKRIFFKCKFKEIGEHTNKITNMAVICLSGKIKIYIKGKKLNKKFILSSPNKLLIIYKNEWRKIISSKKNSIAIFFASHKFLKDEYIYD